MHTKYWLSLLAASMFAFGCSENTDSSSENPNDSEESGNTGNSGDSGDSGHSNTSTDPDDDYPQQPGNIDILDSQFDESLLDGARKLSDNVLVKYYKSNDDDDFGKHETLLDMSTLKANKSSDFVHEGSASAMWSYKKDSITLFESAESPRDLSEYNAIAFWVYIPEDKYDKENGNSFYLYLKSPNPNPPKAADANNGYYGYTVRLTHSGWNYINIKFSDFSKGHSPLGWHKITQIILWQAWANIGNNQSEDVTLYIDNMYVYSDIRDAGLTDSVVPSILDGALFSINGSRAIVENQLIKTSFKNDDSIIYQDGKYPVYDESKELWVPLSVFGARYDKDAVYNDNSHVLKMTLNGVTYIYQADKNFVLVNNKPEKLKFKVGLNGDALFVPLSYIKELMDYSNEYYDSMGMVYLYNNDNFIKNYTFSERLKLAQETLYSRPSGQQIFDSMKNHIGDVHPRIMLTKSDFDRIRDLYKNGDKNDLLHKDIDEYFLRYYGIDKSKYKEASALATYIYNAMIFSMLYQITGDKKYVDRVMNDVDTLSELSNWGTDLNVGNRLTAMAIAYDWLYEALTDEQKKKIEKMVLEKGLNAVLNGNTGFDKTPYADGGTCGGGNHNSVCNSSVMVASIAFAFVPEMKETSIKCMDYAIRHVELGMYEYAPDGAYIASTDYWRLATSFLYKMMASLDTVTGTNYGLFYSPGFPNTPTFTTYLEHNTGTWAYHDGSDSHVYTEPLPWFAKKLNNPMIGRIRRNGIVFTGNTWQHVPGSDVLWYDPKLIGNLSEFPLDAHYEQLGLMVMHSSWNSELADDEYGWDKNNFMTGIHGGKNTTGDDHLDWDIGNFILYYGSQRFITELGHEKYSGTKPHFGNEYFSLKVRQTLYTKRAEGQNTLVIGEVSQSEPDQVSAAVSRLLRSDSNKKSAIGIVDMAPAYEQVTKGQRGLFFKNERSVIVVQDEIQLSSPEIVRWSAHTMHDITILPGNRSATLCKKDTNGQYTLPCLYAEIVSSDKSLTFTSGPAKSFVENYQYNKNEKSLDEYHKLMIISSKVDSFNVAVAFKIIQPNETVTSGSLYTWTPMKDWKLE